MKRIITHRSKVVLALTVLLAVGMTAVSASVALAQVAPGTYLPTIDPTGCPTGSCNLKSGTVECVVNADLSIDCSAYVLGGVGHTNADLLLTANYTRTVDCFNKGTNPQNPVESHTDTSTATNQATLTPSKNGQLSVGERSVSPTFSVVTCPNPNWTPVVRAGSPQLVSFSYTLTFDGFDNNPFIEISAP